MSVKALPANLAWLDRELAPKVWVEARRHYGLLEVRGPDSNPNLMAWAKELGLAHSEFPDDATPWCGLFAGIVVKRAGYEPPSGYRVLGARYFIDFGTHIELDDWMFMDIAIFARPGGNHVGFVVGVGKKAGQEYFLIYGGNQSDAVGFAWIAKSRCIGVRRCQWKIAQPTNVRKIYLTMDGVPSQNEA